MRQCTRMVLTALLLAGMLQSVDVLRPSCVLHAQTSAPYTYPMAQGTILRYHMSGGGGTDTSLVITWVDARMYADPTCDTSDNCAVGMQSHPEFIDGYLRWFPSRITDRGTLQLMGKARDLHQLEYCPTDPPARDTLTLYDRVAGRTGRFDSLASTSLARMLRSFDTTVLGVPSRAFTCSIARPAGTDTVTVADGFGIVREHRASGLRLALSAAVIGDVSYNYGPLNTRLLPLAVDNEWQYDVRYEDFSLPGTVLTSTETHRITADTLMAGARWFVDASSDGERRLLRITPSGLYQYLPSDRYAQLLIPASRAIGAIGQSCIISSSAVDSVFGKPMATVHVHNDTPAAASYDGPSISEIWADGFGMIRSTLRQQVFGDAELLKTLRYARIDGIEYGTPLRAETAPGARPMRLAIDGITPHPARTSSDVMVRFSVTRPATVRLVLRDLLGRTLFTRDIGATAAGAQIARIPAGTLMSGTYLCDVHAGDLNATRTIIVLK